MTYGKLLLSCVSGGESLRLWLLDQRWFSGYLLPALPRQVRWFLRKLYLAPLDLVEQLAHGRKSSSPKRASNFSGAVTGVVHTYEGSGDALLGRLVESAGLTPNSRVLDIGCGFGRLGAAMGTYLNANGYYEGLDIVKDCINWCGENVKSPNGNVKFRHADIYNREYNPSGMVKAKDYRFPFADRSFDVVVLISVFTHMNYEDTANYMREISRMLRPGGMCYASYYFLTPVSLAAMKLPKSTFNFRYSFGSYFTASRQTPEFAIAFNETLIRELYKACGLAPEFRPGEWYQGKIGSQDYMIGRKV
ncbi:class I SAM-dependent methyltransferase [Mesorhizobium sp. M0854]|uniref:class I SAM-dependent methyltransferase n=1 Tax=unclassified Mesorhizobium TaxID=325217 RepID=UPI0033395415